VISTHVLDTEQGRPAPGVRVELYRGEKLVAAGETDSEGRIQELTDAVAPGTYRLVFLLASSPFFRRVELEIALDDSPHFHVPLLLSSYSCMSYRGS
jgi:5-hydroxyisourate hydrolase